MGVRRFLSGSLSGATFPAGEGPYSFYHREPMSPKRHYSRILFLLAAWAALAGCSGPRKLEFPMEVPGGWKLAGKEQLAAATAAQEIQVQGLVSWWMATYTGPAYPTVLL